ncbi:MAG: antitoxin [Gemmatimonadetes bacterium]|nr:antitoxin [Gemmatimonadota bacterium]
MPRTTVDLDEDLLRRLKEKAAREGRTLQSVTNDLLRQALAARPRSDYRLSLRTWKGELQPAVDLFDRDTLFDVMEGP